MPTTHLTLVSPALFAEPAPPPADGVLRPGGRDEPGAPAVRLSIQGRHGVFLVQRDGDEVMVDVTNPQVPRCSCGQPHGVAGDCTHVALLRACGFLARAA